jgi:hypothetical protein
LYDLVVGRGINGIGVGVLVGGVVEVGTSVIGGAIKGVPVVVPV